MWKKPSTGYDKKPKKRRKMKQHYIGSLLIANPKKKSFNEKIVKFLIYLALRLVIGPKKWKDPKKNYEIIDRTYKRIMSADFVFIPSSIAFYLIMACMPVLSLIMFLYQIPVIHEILTNGHFEYTGKYGGSQLNPQGIGEQLSLSQEQYNLLTQADGWVQISKDWIIDDDLLANVLGKFIPGMGDLLKQLASVTKSEHKGIEVGALTATVISLFVSAWIAAGGFAKLVFTQSYMYEHKFLGGYWMNKIKGMFMVLIFSLILFGVLLLNIWVTNSINNSISSKTTRNTLKIIFLVFGLFFGVFAGFILLFKLSPRFSIKVRHIIPGAMVSTIPTAGFLALFGLISSLWTYGNYGAIGTIMYIGMAALLVTYFIFVGLSANVAYYQTFVGKKVKNKWTISKK